MHFLLMSAAPSIEEVAVSAVKIAPTLLALACVLNRWLNVI
ncbi:hypothetical protein [Beijerinckia mobilis]|nr:hypothetical protein [Beijerinckia mobilis]